MKGHLVRFLYRAGKPLLQAVAYTVRGDTPITLHQREKARVGRPMAAPTRRENGKGGDEVLGISRQLHVRAAKGLLPSAEK